MILWLVMIVWNIVWMVHRKPYQRFQVVKLRKLKREILVKR